jgi:hypothetical protein
MQCHFAAIRAIVIACVEAEAQHRGGVHEVRPTPVVVAQRRASEVGVHAHAAAKCELAVERRIECTDVRPIRDDRIDLEVAGVERNRWAKR